MSTKTNSETGWTFPSVSQGQDALWGNNPAAIALPPGYDVKRGTNGANVLRGSDEKMDAIDGRGGNDTIYGYGNLDYIMGGLGNDRIYLGAEQDVVYFNTKLDARTNVDRVMDFKSGEDQIGLARSVFKKLGSGFALKQSAFWTGKNAHDKDDRIIYDKATGSLYYDPDGTGSAAKIKFAILSNKAALSYKDLWVA
jgi:Ca2+-binding RTX toxin-like protein